jgi:RNA polymerase sigma-70 factor (ECF subfamily)
LFERHHLALFRYLRRMTGRRRLAEDLMQETFLRAARAGRLERFRGRESAWLFTIARNLLLDHRRREARRPRPVGLEDARVAAIDGRQQLALGLDEALGQLEDDARDVFLLRELAGLGYREIASVLDATPDAVRSRIHRARLALRELLAPSLQRLRSGKTREVRS